MAIIHIVVNTSLLLLIAIKLPIVQPNTPFCLLISFYHITIITMLLIIKLNERKS